MASVAKRRWVAPATGEKKEAWVVRYLDRGGKHRSRQFARKKEADAYCLEVQNELLAGTHVAQRESRTVAALIEEFVCHIERKHKDGQLGKGYINACILAARYVNPHLGNVLVKDLRWQDIEHLSIKLRDEGTRFGRSLARRTQGNILKVLSTVLGYATRRGYCARNVVPDAMREIGPLGAPPIRQFSRDEIRQLLTTLETRPAGTQARPQLQIKAMVYLAVVCGLRRGEILGLTAAHIDFAEGVIRVRQALDAWNTLKGPKTVAGVRDVPMPTRVAAVVASYVEIAEPDARGLLFRGRGGAQLYAASFNKVWHALLLRAGFPPEQDGDWRHFHALRHFAGSGWLEGGVPLTEVSRLMGHSSAAITAKVYAHAIVGTLQRAPEIERMSLTLLPAPAHELRTAGLNH